MRIDRLVVLAMIILSLATVHIVGAEVGAEKNITINSHKSVTSTSATSTSNKMILIFARGTDGALWFRNYNSPYWQSLGGQITSDPDAVSCIDNHVDVFARGTDNALWLKSADISIYGGIAWNDWKYLGGSLKSGPGAASGGSYYDSQGLPTCNISVYVRGTDDALYYKKFDGSIWEDWSYIGGKITSDPDADGDLYQNSIVARGTDNAIWMYTIYEGAFLGWQYIGGNSTSGPAYVAGDVYTGGTDNALWIKMYDFASSQWLDWQSLGGQINSDPDAVFYNPNEYVVVQGTDNAVWIRSYNIDWQTWSNWKSLGGIITSGPSIVVITY